MPERLLNWGLMANPANWIVIFLMLAIASIGVTAIWSSWNTQPPQ